MASLVSVLRFLLAFLLLTAPCSVAYADYRLAPGDVLEISAVGVPELGRRVPIDVDGLAVFPLIGAVEASGLTLAELRTKVGELLPAKILRRKTVDGRYVADNISPDELTVEVVEYRPVYLDGDVAKPGAQPFRPGLTVREAVALAGGYDVMRLRGRDPFLESSDLRSEYTSLWTDFAREQVIIARIEAEIAGNAEFEKPNLGDIPISKTVVQQILALEAEQLNGRNADQRKEIDYLESAINTEDERISTLSERLQKERQGADADARDMAQMRETFQKSIVPLTRLEESRRLELVSSTQALQTASLVEQFQRQRQDLARKLERTRDQHRTDLAALLEEAHIKLAALTGRIQAVGEKLVYSGVVRSQLVRGTGGIPKITITRRDGEGRETTTEATESTQLHPGDTIEVALRIVDVAPRAASVRE
jgi:polysaccharide export outer membrane protein